MSVRINPLEVEQRYQELVLSLSLPATPYQRLAAIASFLGFLGDAASVYESHVIDVADRFCSCVTELHACGHAPGPLEEMIHAIDAGIRQTDGALEVEGVPAGLNRAKCLCALAYAYVASWTDVLRILDVPVPPNLDLAALPPGEDALRQIVEALPAAERVQREQMEEVRGLLAAETSASPQSAWFPVIERPPDMRSQLSGALRQVGARILGHSADGHDSVTADVAVLGVGPTGGGVTDIPMQAVRAWLRRRGVSDDEPMAGQVNFSGGHALHEGHSSDLAIAAVLGCAVLRHNRERIQFRFRRGVAFTGALNGDGMVEPVDASTLRLKVEATFCSPTQVLVLPRGQAEIAETYVRELQVRYPLRTLAIVGVRMLDDVFYDLRVIEPLLASLVKHAARTMWARKSRTVALISTTVLLLVGVWLVLGRLDREPIRVEFEGDRLRVLNRYDAAIATIHVGEATVAKWGRLTSPWDSQHGYVFADVDGDGRKDIIYTQSSDPTSGGAAELVAQSLDDHHRFWTYSIVWDYDFPDRPDTRTGTFNINDVITGDVDADGVADLFLAAAHTPSFPGLVQRIDVRTGHALQTYVHTGHVADIGLADLDTDGVVELFVCGTNNAFNRAFLAVIDARSIGGCSPHTPAYHCARPSESPEEVYALLPRSILGTTLGTDQKGNGAQFLRIDITNGEVTVCVNDNKGNAIQTPVTVPIILNFAFDRQIRPVAIAAGDSFDKTASWAVEQGYLPAVPSAAYFDGLKNQVRVWKSGKEAKSLP